MRVLLRAPYGYRYVTKQDGDGEARFEIVLEEARVVRQVFEWVGRDHYSINRGLKTALLTGVNLITDKTDMTGFIGALWVYQSNA